MAPSAPPIGDRPSAAHGLLVRGSLYHQPGDTIDKLNVSYLRSMIQLTAAATALLAAPENGSRQQNPVLVSYMKPLGKI